MSGRSEFAALQWMWRACSPFAQTPALPRGAVWADIFRVADRHLVLPRLAIALLPRRQELEAEVADFLEAALELNQYRNDRLRAQLLTFCRALNGVGIEPILLKGAPFLLAEDDSRYERMMLDIDIWVPDRAELERAVRCFQHLGYAMREDPATSSHTQHYPPFFHPDEISRVELHWDMVNAQLASMVDQSAILGGLRTERSDGISYRLLDERTALGLSYLQCRLGVGTAKGYVTMMKWLDFLDRAHRLEAGEIRERADLGLLGDTEEADRQFLTALKRWADFPYSGAIDDRFIRFWEHSYREPLIVGYAKTMFGPVFDLRRWRGKSPAELLRSARQRMKKLSLIHQRARSRDHFGS